MRPIRCAAMLPLFLAFALAAARDGFSHEPTVQRFQRERALAVSEIEASQLQIQEKAMFANSDEREAVLRVYREASAALKAQIAPHAGGAQTNAK